MHDPVDNIQWLPVDSLEANDYNPNRVATPEMKLLEESILRTGWIQPILVSHEGVIIDGFHRATLAKTSKAMRERYGGLVPCAVLRVSRPEAMMMTVRINRAKGTHAAVPMSRIIRELIDVHGLTPEEIMRGIGASREEVDLLYQEDVFKARNIANWRYSRAWVPKEEKR